MVSLGRMLRGARPAVRCPGWSAPAAGPGGGRRVAVSPGPLVAMPIAWWTSIGAARLCLWLIWFGVHAVRVGAAAAAFGRPDGNVVNAPPRCSAAFHHWSRIRASGRATRVVLSERIRSAGVLGGGAP